MSNSFDINRVVDSVPVIDFMQELMINRPDRAIAQISSENRIRVQAFELIIATHTDTELMDIFAPWHITGDEERILTFIRAIRLCIQYRRPEWKS